MRVALALGAVAPIASGLASAASDDQTFRNYPCIVEPPSAGCWRLTITTGKLRNALAVRVDP